MKEKPILFSGPMIQAILEGRKTQTRRIFKDQKIFQECYDFFNCDNYGCAELQVSEYDRGFGLYMGCGEYPDEGSEFWKSPYGKIGDQLWVRETWRKVEGKIQYRAEAEKEIKWASTLGWKPSIHMRREYSRINLEITDIRVQQVQDISEEDAKAEGCEAQERSANTPYDFADDGHFAVDDFAGLWNWINGKVGANGVDIGWKANPWVWALTFKRI